MKEKFAIKKGQLHGWEVHIPQHWGYGVSVWHTSTWREAIGFMNRRIRRGAKTK